jgi:hypothetical protein
MKSASSSAKRTPTSPKATKTEVATATAPAATAPAATAPTLVSAEALREAITPAITARIQTEADAATKGKAPSELAMPFANYLAEAHGLAATIAKYWRSPDPKKYPALSRFSRRLPESTSAEIVHLIDLVQGSRNKARLLVAVADPVVLERAKFVYRELRAAAEFDADDGVEDVKDHELAVLKRSHETEPGSLAELAAAIASFSAHASAHKASFETIPDFDMALLAEAASLVDALRLRKTNTDTSAGMAAQARDIYLALLDRRLASARKVFRYAYRAYPEVVREATSAYERDRRRAARKLDDAEGDEPSSPRLPLPPPLPPLPEDESLSDGVTGDNE